MQFMIWIWYGRVMDDSSLTDCLLCEWVTVMWWYRYMMDEWVSVWVSSCHHQFEENTYRFEIARSQGQTQKQTDWREKRKERTNSALGTGRTLHPPLPVPVVVHSRTGTHYCCRLSQSEIHFELARWTDPATVTTTSKSNTNILVLIAHRCYTKIPEPTWSLNDLNLQSKSNNQQ